MRFAIITATPHTLKHNVYYAYGPFVREMNIWTKYVSDIEVLATRSKSQELREIDISYDKGIKFSEVPSFNILTLKGILKTLMVTPIILYKIFRVMQRADHIHLRCPCNVSLLACFVQILFPKKPKTTKYAGNWDPNSRQPWSYRLQKRILSNRFLTKNMKVLVYGEWPNQTKNIVPFISATYYEAEKQPWYERNYNGKLSFVFVASMVPGKRPFLTIQIIENLMAKGLQIELHMFGGGHLIEGVNSYVRDHNLSEVVFVHGNKSKQRVKEELMRSHFGILPSKSEGWPKAIAETMFFGSIPISTDISCLRWMLDNGNRGIIIEPDVKSAAEQVYDHIKKKDLIAMSRAAQEWSHQYTLNTLEKAIKETLLDS